VAPGFVTLKSSPTAPQARVDLVEANERQRRPVIVAHVGRRGVLQERLYDLLVALTARLHPVELRFVAVCRLVPPNPSGPKSDFALQPRELKP